MYFYLTKLPQWMYRCDVCFCVAQVSDSLIYGAIHIGSSEVGARLWLFRLSKYALSGTVKELKYGRAQFF